MATAVVCDDDAVLRGAISGLCADNGLEVVAETDSGADAVMLVRRFGVDVLILDLSLTDGSGERALASLQEDGVQVAAVVFTAYAAEPENLIALGAREVIEKPDLEALAVVLARLGTSLDEVADANTTDRRLATRDIEESPTLWRSPSGVSPHNDLAHSYLTMEPGDAVLTVCLLGLEALEADVGTLLTQDCRLAVARVLRYELRIQDLLHDAPELEGFAALLRGGDARAADAVWSRLTVAVRKEGLIGELHGAGARVDAHGGADAVARSVGALQGVVVGGPAFISV